MTSPLDWTKTMLGATSTDFFIKIQTILDQYDVYKKQRVTFIALSSLLVSILQIPRYLYLERHLPINLPINRFFHAVVNNNGYQQEIHFLETMF
jgi:hypothetical protein